MLIRFPLSYFLIPNTIFDRPTGRKPAIGCSNGSSTGEEDTVTMQFYFLIRPCVDCGNHHPVLKIGILLSTALLSAEKPLNSSFRIFWNRTNAKLSTWRERERERERERKPSAVKISKLTLNPADVCLQTFRSNAQWSSLP